MNRREIAEKIFLAGIESVLPDRLIANCLSLSGDVLMAGEHRFIIEDYNKIYVIGAGKATALMAAAVEKVLGDRITGGQIVVKYGYSCKLKHIEITEAGHPIPDTNGFRATEKIFKIASSAGVNDLVICLLSGGGSSLLADYPPGSSQAEIMIVNDLLVNSGACISEINAVRKHLSGVKGGQLSRCVFPATLISLILSDVPGDHLDVIASGPTTDDPTTFRQALEVLENFNLKQKIPALVLKHLNDGITGSISETPKAGDKVFEKTFNILAGTNKTALEAARLKALEFNINAVIVDDQLQGDSETVAGYVVETALQFKLDKTEIKPVCLLFGGETTVKMTGRGTGGRNQHLALLCSRLLSNHDGITILSGGTDGTDGPTDVAGAVVDSDTVRVAESKNIDAGKFIEEFDSWHFFKKTGGHIITGPTMTNFMDLIIVLIF